MLQWTNLLYNTVFKEELLPYESKKKTTNPLAVQLPLFKTNLWSCTMEQRDQWNCCFQYKLKWTGENILLKGDLLRFALFSALLQWWMLVLNMAKILNYGLKAQDSVFAYLGYLWFHWGSRDIPNMILSGTQLYLDPSIFLCGAWSLSCSFGGRSASTERQTTTHSLINIYG